MAEEKKKGFYQFSITRNSEKIEKLKAKIPFAHLLQTFEVNEDEDEDAIVAKMNNAIAAIMNASEVRTDGGNIKEKNEKLSNLPQGLKEVYLKEVALTDADKDKYEEYKYKRNLAENQSEKEALKQDYEEIIAKKGNEEKYLGEGVELNDLEKEAEILEGFPDKQKRDLVNFYKHFKKEGKLEEFEKLYADVLSDDNGKFRPEYVYMDDGSTIKRDNSGNRVIKNEHRLSINHGEVCHSILNLNGSDLDITWMGDSFGFARSYDYMTPEQIKALAEYCVAKGIDIKNFGGLSDLKVKDGVKEIGSVADVLSKEIKGPGNDSDNSIDSDNTQLTEDEKKYVSESDSVYDKLSKDLDHGEGTKSPYDYLKDPNLDIKKSVMVKAAEVRSALMGNCDPALTNIKRGWNTTVISVYANENDKLVDGEYDKNGRRTRTKRFAVELTASTPPSARIYMGTDKEFSADHARLILDGFKKCGCKYFIVPPADQIGGKKAMGAWLKACVKAKMIPLCKTSKDSEGMVLGAADLHGLKEAFDEEVKSGGITGNAKVEFMLRVAEQLERQEKYQRNKDPKYQTDSAVQTKIEYFKYGAVLDQLNSSHLQSLEEFISDGIEKRGWDLADKTAAVLAMGHVIKDMSKGKLNGKNFNPLGDKAANWQEMERAMVYYMIREKPRVIDDIENRLNAATDVKEGRIDKIAGDIARNAEVYVTKVCTKIHKDTGIEIKPDIDKSKPSFSMDNYNNKPNNRYEISYAEEKDNNGNVKEDAVGYSKIAKETKEYDKYKKSNNKSTESFEDWKKRSLGGNQNQNVR